MKVTSKVRRQNPKIVCKLIGLIHPNLDNSRPPFTSNFLNMDVYVVGHIKLVNVQSLINRPVLDEVEIAIIQSVVNLENILSGSKKKFNVLIIFCLMFLFNKDNI